MFEKTIEIAKETLEKAIEAAVAIRVTDGKVKDIVVQVSDHEKRIAKLEGTSDLNIEKVKVAFLEAKEQFRLLGGKKDK